MKNICSQKRKKSFSTFWTKKGIKPRVNLDEEPFRSELLSIEQLKHFARDLALEHKTEFGSGYNRLLPRLHDNTRVLREVHELLAMADIAGQRMLAPEEWFLDNSYLIEQQIELARIHLPKRYSHLLPRLCQGPHKGMPRVYGIAAELIAHQDGLLDKSAISAFVNAYQTVKGLKLGELWAVPISLRLGIIENLRRISGRIAWRRSELDKGIAWANRILDVSEKDPGRLIHLLAKFVDTQPTLSAPFLSEFVRRLQGQGSAVSIILNWVEQALSDEGTTIAQSLQKDSYDQAAEHLSITNSISSLRFIGSMDWKSFVEDHSLVEQILRRDPAGAYALQDFATRDNYRHIVEKLSKSSGLTETEVAQKALEQAAMALNESDSERDQHIGAYFIGRRKYAFRKYLKCSWLSTSLFGTIFRRFKLFFYLSLIFFLTSIFALVPLVLPGSDQVGWSLYLLIMVSLVPALSLAISLVNFLVTAYIPPNPLPRLDFSEGIPDEFRTMVVVPTLLKDNDSIDSLLEGLEIRYLGNRDLNLHFALLTDFADADTETTPNDSKLLEKVIKGIDLLNARYPRDSETTTFFLFHRNRIWNSYEKCWMAYERKRGKLEQFNALLRGENPEAFSIKTGDLTRLKSIQYVITLDSDTDLPRGAAHGLVGAMAHPLNKPHFDSDKGRVTEGYAILQPRVSIRLSAARHSLFSKLLNEGTGLDPYSREVSDVYQDLFGEGSFIGKGIYDVDVFRKALDGRFPENIILSHDLIESAYARSGLLGCVELYENAPSSYLEEIGRQHRWMRGDWQIIPWLRQRPPSAIKKNSFRKPVSFLMKWKIADNFRRAIFSPFLFGLIVIGWTISQVSPYYWTFFALAVLGISGVTRSLSLLLRKPKERSLGLHIGARGKTLIRHIGQALFDFSVLPYEAWMALNAFVRSALRGVFTRRGLLVWHLPLYKRLSKRKKVSAFYLEMWPASFCAVLSISLMYHMKPTAWQAVVPFALLWLASPLVSWIISKPIQKKSYKLSDLQLKRLRQLACRTWRYFDTFINERDNYLPPDNFQEVPKPMIASRTSPTNIGFALTSYLTAWDFGYISTHRLLENVEKTLDSMEKLERYRGHFYNWYDTKTLEPLPPRYVSSVDSGNLAACLIAIRVGLRGLCDQPVLPSQIWGGLSDALEIGAENSKKAGSIDFINYIQKARHLLTAVPEESGEILERLSSLLFVAEQLKKLSSSEYFSDASEWAMFFYSICFDHLKSAELLLNEQKSGISLRKLAKIKKENFMLTQSFVNAAVIMKKIEELAERCQQIQDGMDFRFLYHENRELLSIGFNVDSRKPDNSYYDLLASESRIASFFIIAEEQAPPEHWFALGRLMTGDSPSETLVSWSGSMFEYLMPSLLMSSYEGTLLDKACRAVIKRQINYGKQRNVPWGISESCYNGTDAKHVYQYRAFGVPSLGLKRGLSDDLVIAPYATLLALLFDPVSACANLDRLTAIEGVLGQYGLIEAIDYTPTRRPRGKSHALVHCYMSHHQGMGLLALSHLLLNAPMVRRFMSEPAIRATELLLQEKIPDIGPSVYLHKHEAASVSRPEIEESGGTKRSYNTPNIPLPEVHMLSNGNYLVMVNQAGGGFSSWRNLSLTRWREDVTCDNWGTFLYIREIESNNIWSNSYQPICRIEKKYEAEFTQGHVEFRRVDFDIETKTELCVSPEDDVEIRKITFTNQGRNLKHLELTSYAEVVLSANTADLAHRAFNNLFVKTEILPSGDTILCTRLKREDHEPDVWYFHTLFVVGQKNRASCESDRARFLGRNRTPADPVAMATPPGEYAPLSNSSGAVLDPIVAVRQQITLPDYEPVQVNMVFGVASSRQEAISLADKYRDSHFVERAFDMAWSHSQIIMRLLNVSKAEAQTYGRLASSIFYANPRNRAPWPVVVRNTIGQQGLWRFGISGDNPIIFLRISDIRKMDLVNDALRAHAYWRLKGLITDLIIINEDYSGYRASLNDTIISAINMSLNADMMDKPGGIFLRRIENLSEEDQILFQSAARVVLTDGAENFKEQVDQRYVQPRPMPLLKPQSRNVEETVKKLEQRERVLVSGPGGFTADGKEYVIMLEPGMTTPAPWSNVIAGKRFGMVLSESGSGYSWVDNAHEYRLTTWHNDPVSAPCGEVFYMRDEETGHFWSLTPKPAPGLNGYICRHGFGYSVFEHIESELKTELWIYSAIEAPLRCAVVKIYNTSSKWRSISLCAFHELVLGEWRHDNLMHIYTEEDSQSGLLLARNPYSRIFPKRIVFASCSEAEVFLSGDRTEFIGRNGSMGKPAAMFQQNLSNRCGAKYDPAAVLQTFVEIAPGASKEIVFTLGAADSMEEARELYHLHGRPAGARSTLEAVWEYWNNVLGAVTVHVPDEPAFNVMVNGRLLYQALACRVWGRSGYYQSGGAYGFRDQLQDAMALIHASPEILRELVLLFASRQFPEGDVQHWWHPPSGAGVRTRITDDRLWLVQAVSRYVLSTGDTGVLDEMVPFLESKPLAEGEESRYDQYFQISDSASLYEHCIRAIRISLSYGVHGLPLIGGGDWNDGMNLVGISGKGESVWMAWFLGDTLNKFEKIARLRGDVDFAELCLEERESLRIRAEDSAWDGDWYRRAYFDDGTPLGSAANEECKIDAISQSWAVLSGMGRSKRVQQAMMSVLKHLVKYDEGLILLLSPPFAQADPDPGYIKKYPPGIRENGGQYTHAAIWTAMAFAELGEHEIAWSLFNLLNPAKAVSTHEAMNRYKVENYVMSADIYGVEPHIGRGGWSWYTGAAGWMYRLAVETFLGLERHPDYLILKPRLPENGPQTFLINYRYNNNHYKIEATRAPKNSKYKVIFDGHIQKDECIPLIKDGRDHDVKVFFI
ncbi:MAG: glucoamylase family protein [Dissulfurispiraceae bacterium]|jgi:cellobiose phosphorylase|nr:glucoamylase family protein [Dissulfurispiraceae bacterium]